jgi:hypothetical protein
MFAKCIRAQEERMNDDLLAPSFARLLMVIGRAIVGTRTIITAPGCIVLQQPATC